MPSAPAIFCANCGYDLNGLPSRPCPECSSTKRSTRPPLPRHLRALRWLPLGFGFAACFVAMATVYANESWGQLGMAVMAPPVAGIFNAICSAFVGASITAHRTRLLSPVGKPSGWTVLGNAIGVGVLAGAVTTLVTYPACWFILTNFQHGSGC